MARDYMDGKTVSEAELMAALRRFVKRTRGEKRRGPRAKDGSR